MYWQKDARQRAGGHWYCAVRQRERTNAYYHANAERVQEQRRDYYDRNALKTRMKQQLYARRRRLAALERRLRRR